MGNLRSKAKLIQISTANHRCKTDIISTFGQKLFYPLDYWLFKRGGIDDQSIFFEILGNMLEDRKYLLERQC